MAENDTPAPNHDWVRRWKKAIKKIKGERDEAVGMLGELSTENERLQGEVGKTAKERDDLNGKLKTDRYRREFEKAAKAAKVRPDALDDLWKLAEIKQDADEPDSKAITSSIKEATKGRAYLLESADGEDEGDETDGDDESTAKPLTKGDGHDRGPAAKGPATHMTVRRSDMSNPKWMRENQEKYVTAVENGTIRYV